MSTELRYDLDNILDRATLIRKTDVIATLTKINTAARNGTLKRLPAP